MIAAVPSNRFLPTSPSLATEDWTELGPASPTEPSPVGHFRRTISNEPQPFEDPIFDLQQDAASPTWKHPTCARTLALPAASRAEGRCRSARADALVASIPRAVSRCPPGEGGQPQWNHLGRVVHTGGWGIGRRNRSRTALDALGGQIRDVIWLHADEFSHSSLRRDFLLCWLLQLRRRRLPRA